MARGIFVTGTDTGVGKTAISVALLRALRGAGVPALGFKPLETGCPGGAPGADARALAQAAGAPLSECAWACLPEPLAPSEAARRAGVPLEIEALEAVCRDRLDRPGWVILEGAGGIRVPIAPGYTFLELAQALDLPTLVVAKNGLGVLNQTLLTVDALRSAGVPVAGVVLNEVSDGPPDLARQTNAGVLAEWLGEIPLIPAPHLGPSPGGDAQAALGRLILAGAMGWTPQGEGDRPSS